MHMFGHDNNQDDGQGQDNFSGSEAADSGAAPAIVPQMPHDDAADKPKADDTAAPVVPQAPMPSPTATDDLLDIKQQALHELTPLVGQLEQTPEEQFRTTMMMIQASDNHDLIRTAYDAAKQIANEKERAQALLDIVNEINYFTQHSQA
jgi:hypothetical protein